LQVFKSYWSSHLINDSFKPVLFSYFISYSLLQSIRPSILEFLQTNSTITLATTTTTPSIYTFFSISNATAITFTPRGGKINTFLVKWSVDSFGFIECKWYGRWWYVFFTTFFRMFL